jgi:dihydroorotate dehydrogenase (fumarate)
MITLETSYLGLKLKNPVIVSSSGLTNSAQKNLALEKAGAGAIILKSLFEEQIMMNGTNLLHHNAYAETSDYIKKYVQANSLTDYLELIAESRRLCSIPIIASINCYRSSDWATFAHQIEMAGSNAIELNIFILNTNKQANSDAVEQEYINIVKQTRKAVTIPISVKIGMQFTGLVALSEKLVGAGANSIVLFNRFYQPDIDLQTIEFKQGETFSTAADFANTLRWTSLISGLVKDANVVSSTGIHDWENGVKAILAGAQAFEICSTLYKNGNGVISEIITRMESWMEQHGYLNINEFRGKLNYANISNPALYERAQFMKYNSDNGRHKGEIYFS